MGPKQLDEKGVALNSDATPPPTVRGTSYFKGRPAWQDSIRRHPSGQGRCAGPLVPLEPSTASLAKGRRSRGDDLEARGGRRQLDGTTCATLLKIVNTSRFVHVILAQGPC